jgi:cytochrome c2
MKSKAIRSFSLAIIFLLSACSGDTNGVPEPHPSPKSNIEAGRQLIASYGCGACHTIPGVAGADAMVAPPLNCFYDRSYIAGRLPNTEDNLVKWIQHPQEIEPGVAMPDLGVSEAEAHDIAAFLYHRQLSLDDWIIHCR